MSGIKGRLGKLEAVAPAAAKARVRLPGELGKWWRSYLDQNLSTTELVDLAEAVTAENEGRPLTAEQELAASVAWGQVWNKATDLDLRRLVRAFGPRGGWRQILTAEPK